MNTLVTQLEEAVRLPVRPQAKATFEKMLVAAQEILQEQGIEALNSNLVVEKAGVTAPVFYHYFKNKHAILLVLASRFLDAQDEIFERHTQETHTTPEDVRRISFAILKETYTLTSNTVGASALLTALRAIPELSQYRVEANSRAAHGVARQLRAVRPELSEAEAYERTLLGVEIGYGAIEMLLEHSGLNNHRTLQVTAQAIVAVYFE